MIGVYFSGSGNTLHCIEYFVSEIDSSAKCMSIEDVDVVSEMQKNDTIILAYPIYFSNLPKIMRDFINENKMAFVGKKIFIISTMGLFSGDGTGCSARVLVKCGANIIGGLHLKMPDCIGDEKALKKTIKQNKELVVAAHYKINEAVKCFVNNTPTQEGLSFLSHMAGLFGQRLWFYNKTKNYSNKLKINHDKCIGCGKCVALCPLTNLKLENNKVVTNSKCTMCYRCVSNCPTQAITLLGKKVYEQCIIDKYL